jgi:hypothetical protein
MHPKQNYFGKDFTYKVGLTCSPICIILSWLSFIIVKSRCYKPTPPPSPLEESHPRDSGSSQK